MRRVKIWPLGSLLFIALLVGGCTLFEPVTVPTGTVQVQGLSSDESNQYLVMFKGRNLPKQFRKELVAGGGDVVTQFDEFGVAVVKAATAALDAAVAGDSRVETYVHDFGYQFIDDQPSQATLEPDGAAESQPSKLWGWQWNMQRTAVAPAHRLATGRGVRVAVLDSGVDYTHPDLTGRIDVAAGASFVGLFPESLKNYPYYEKDLGGIMDYNGHGTHVAGIIAAQGPGVIGVAPAATIVPIKVSGAPGNAAWASLVAGLNYAMQQNVDVVNVSLGTCFVKGNGAKKASQNDSCADGSLARVLKRIFTRIQQRGIVVVASAGNDAQDLNHTGGVVYLPAEAATLSVGATTLDDGGNETMALYSNYGISGVDIFAPGGDPSHPILSTWSRQSVVVPNAPYAFAIGTSMAAPHVAGVAALTIERYGRMSVGALRSLIKRTADDLGHPGVDVGFGHGRVDAYRAVSH